MRRFKRRIFLFSLLLFLMGSVFYASRQPVFVTSGSSPKLCVKNCGSDPQQLLWDAQNGGGFEFGTVLTVSANLAVSGYNNNALKLSPNSTETAVALTNNPVDVGSILSKNLLVGSSWAMPSGCCGNTNVPWGLFLRLNGTLPTEAGYDPRLDKSVVFMLNHWVVSAGTLAWEVSIERTPSVAISPGDTGSCSSSGTCFVFGSRSTTGFNPAADLIQDQAVLNFTGASAGNPYCTGGFGNACSTFTSTDFFTTNQISLTSLVLPWLDTGRALYVGVYALKGLNAVPYFTFDLGNGSLSLWKYTPSVGACTAANPCSTAQPTIDTGGWLGSVVKGFLSIVSYILLPGFGVLLNVVPGAIWTALGNAIQSVLTAIVGNININTFAAAVGNVLGPGFGNLILGVLDTITNALFGLSLSGFEGAVWNAFTNGLSWVGSFLISWGLGVFQWLQFVIKFTTGGTALLGKVSRYATNAQFWGLVFVYWLLLLLDEAHRGVGGVMVLVETTFHMISYPFKLGWWFAMTGLWLAKWGKTMVTDWI